MQTANTSSVRASAKETPRPSRLRPRYPLQHFLHMRKDRLGFFEEMQRQGGDAVRFRLINFDLWLLSDPEVIKEVFTTHNDAFVKGRGLDRAKVLLGNGLLTSEGNFHLRQRRLAQPAFHRQRIHGYAEAMVDEAERTAASWAERPQGHVDMLEEMMRLTLAIVGRTLFGARVDTEEASEVTQAMEDVMPIFADITLPFSQYLQKLPIPRYQRFRRARARLDSLLYKRIEERRSAADDNGDLLSMLLLARDAETDGSGMTDLQVRDEAMTLFLAGHETTANALTWTFYLLSQHPQVEAKLHAELGQVLGSRRVSAADYPLLPYTTAIFSESMRLYPPAWLMGRRALRDVRVGGYDIQANETVVMSPWLVQRDPRWFPDPLAFKPERWIPDLKAHLPRYAYFPFGGGTRQCIGESFAWMEGVLVLATLARKFSAKHREGHVVELQPLITLRPKHGMEMILRERSAVAQAA